VATLSGGDGVGQAGNGDPVAPSGIPLVLALALEIRAAVSGSPDSRSDSADEQRQPCGSSELNPREFVGGFERLAIACLHGDVDKRSGFGRPKRTPNSRPRKTNRRGRPRAVKAGHQTWNRQQRLIVASLFLTLFLVFGSGFNTAGVFFEPLLRHFGWTRARLSSLQTVLGLSAGVSAPFLGWLLDRVDAGAVIASGVCVSGAALLLASRANSYDAFLIAYAMLGVGIAAVTLLPCSQVLANWFGERRGTALGLAMSGTSLGGMLMTLVAADAVRRAEWRAGYVALALPMLLINVPLVLAVVRTRPETGGLAEALSSGSGLEISEALRGR
jgi:hypothetical protein